MDSSKSSQPNKKRGFPLYAVMIVLTIVVIAVVGARIARQHRGTLWQETVSNPSKLAPKCVLPGEEAKMDGKITVYPDMGGFSCAVIDTVGPLSADGIADLLDSNKETIDSACGTTGRRTYYAQGSYSCHDAADKQGFVASEPQSLAGADRSLVDILRHNTKCPGGSSIRLLKGTISAYKATNLRTPCGEIRIGDQPLVTDAFLKSIEAQLAAQCGATPMWYVLKDGQYRCEGSKENFYCRGETSSRENYRGRRRHQHSGFRSGQRHDIEQRGKRERFCAGCAGVSGFRSGRRNDIQGRVGVSRFDTTGACKEGYTPGFSPDVPGACAGCGSHAKRDATAANYELNAIRTLQGAT
jgi:hypothetical protein